MMTVGAEFCISKIVSGICSDPTFQALYTASGECSGTCEFQKYYSMILLPVNLNAYV